MDWSGKLRVVKGPMTAFDLEVAKNSEGLTEQQEQSEECTCPPNYRKPRGVKSLFKKNGTA